VTESVAASAFTLTNDVVASRYELRRDDALVSVLDYRDDGRTVALTRAFTTPNFRGQGLAARVVEGAVEHIAEQGDRQVDAVCWYVAEWFDQHPEQEHLLRRR